MFVRESLFILFRKARGVRPIVSLAHVYEQEPVDAILGSAYNEVGVALVQVRLHGLGLPALVDGYAEDAFVDRGKTFCSIL